jgi:gamma-glutamyltranspeptidase/glutathione hydrolase
MKMRSSLRHLLSSALLVALACGSGAPPQAFPGLPIGPTLPEPDIFASLPDAPPKSGERRLPGGSAEGNRVALGTKGAVASQENFATDVGLEILKKGGSSVDAAIAVGFALAVTHPSAGNIGGGGFMLIRNVAGDVHAADFRERAPKAASRDMYLDKKGEVSKDATVGPKSAGIPGTVAGFWLAHQKFGKLPWAELVAPAIKLAKEGVLLDKLKADSLKKAAEGMRKEGYESTAKHLESAKGALNEGELWLQPDLAVTLERIAKEGPPGFYRGPVAEKLVKGVKKGGGIWTLQDLSSYEAKWRAPVVFNYRNHTIVTMPPPSAGGVVLQQMLGMSEALDLKQSPWRGAEEIHLFAETMRRAHADRNQLLGDPDFVKMPLETILSPEYIAARAKTIDRAKATPSSAVSAGASLKPQSTETTHYSVIDEAGNAVSTTYTLNTGYGAKYIVDGTGVLLNNEMDDFASAPGKPNTFGLVQGEANKIEPGKRMLSSMTPTIIVKDGEVRAVLGSPGGSTISTTVAQLTRALIDYDIPLDRAVPAIRAHHQWMPDAIMLDGDVPADVKADLEARGHKLMSRGRIGHANCIEVDPKTRGFRAVADTTRSGGKAAAY